MALPQQIKDVFSDSPSVALGWAKAILASHAAAMEAEDALHTSAQSMNAGISEFGNLRWSIHSQVLDAVSGLISVAEMIAKEGR